MNRSEIYSGEQTRTFDHLTQWKDIVTAFSDLATAYAGTSATVVGGLTATQTSPATLNINLARGWLFQQAALDSTSFGSLPADATLVQQAGASVAQQVALTTAALSAGQSQ